MVRVVAANDMAGSGTGGAGAAGAVSVAEPAFARLAIRAVVPVAVTVGDADGAEQRGEHFQPGEVVASAGDARASGDARAGARRHAGCHSCSATTGRPGAAFAGAPDAPNGSAGCNGCAIAGGTASRCGAAAGQSVGLAGDCLLSLAGGGPHAGGAVCLGQPSVWAAADRVTRRCGTRRSRNCSTNARSRWG